MRARIRCRPKGPREFLGFLVDRKKLKCKSKGRKNSIGSVLGSLKVGGISVLEDRHEALEGVLIREEGAREKSGEEGGRGKCAERPVNGGSGACERGCASGWFG